MANNTPERKLPFDFKIDSAYVIRPPDKGLEDKILSNLKASALPTAIKDAVRASLEQVFIEMVGADGGFAEHRGVLRNEMGKNVILKKVWVDKLQAAVHTAIKRALQSLPVQLAKNPGRSRKTSGAPAVTDSSIISVETVPPINSTMPLSGGDILSSNPIKPSRKASKRPKGK